MSKFLNLSSWCAIILYYFNLTKKSRWIKIIRFFAQIRILDVNNDKQWLYIFIELALSFNFFILIYNSFNQFGNVYKTTCSLLLIETIKYIITRFKCLFIARYVTFMNVYLKECVPWIFLIARTTFVRTGKNSLALLPERQFLLEH